MRKIDYTASRELVGKRFGTRVITDVKLHVTVYPMAYLVCDCGRERWANVAPVLKGSGCASCNGGRREHGLGKTQAAKAWRGMIRRCETDKNYHGRGINVSDKWKKSFVAFLEDMGPVHDGMSLDRIDNDGNYEPGNCRWTTREVQNRNKRNNLILSCDGVTMCVKDWETYTGLRHTTITYRLRNGWTSEEALKIPPSKGIGNKHRDAVREAGTLKTMPILRGPFSVNMGGVG